MEWHLSLIDITVFIDECQELKVLQNHSTVLADLNKVCQGRNKCLVDLGQHGEEMMPFLGTKAG